jgi:hypothetical protein
MPSIPEMGCEAGFLNGPVDGWPARFDKTANEFIAATGGVA